MTGNQTAFKNLGGKAIELLNDPYQNLSSVPIQPQT
jgi:hypothetical protein